MNKLTVNQALNVFGTVIFLLLTLMSLTFYLLSKHSISATSDFTLSLMSLTIVLAMIDIVFVILTIRSFLYPNQTITPSQSFDELFVD